MDYVLLREVVSGPPVSINIETTNLCNLRCLHCRHSAGPEHYVHGKGRMPFEDFQALVDKLPASWHRSVCVLGRDGEPLMNDGFERYAAYYRDRTGTAPCLATNGTLLTRERSAALLDAGVREVRCDFCADETYYNRMRQGAAWDAVLANLRGFLETAAKKGVEASLAVGDIQADTMPGRRGKLDALRRTRALFEGHEGFAGVYRIALFSSFGYYDGARVAGRNTYTYCHEPWFSFVVDFAGRAVACCRDLRSEYVLGDAFGTECEAIWNGERMRSVRRAIAGKRPERIATCAQCDMPHIGGFTGRGRPARRILTHGARLVAMKARRLAGADGGLYW